MPAEQAKKRTKTRQKSARLESKGIASNRNPTTPSKTSSCSLHPQQLVKTRVGNQDHFPKKKTTESKAATAAKHAHQIFQILDVSSRSNPLGPRLFRVDWLGS
jgi:hypothetical protein